MINIELLKRLRKSKKLTQADVAKILNKSQQAYAFYENGTNEPDSDTLKKLCDLFSCSLNELLGITEMQTDEILETNTLTVYGRGFGKKTYKLSEQKIAAIKALLDAETNSDNIDF